MKDGKCVHEKKFLLLAQSYGVLFALLDDASNGGMPSAVSTGKNTIGHALSPVALTWDWYDRRSTLNAFH